MNNITRQRKEEILTRCETDKAIFNWCEEYNQFIRDCVHQKSYDDADTPLSYEDLDLFDRSGSIENMVYSFPGSDSEFMEYANNPDTFNRRVKTADDFGVFLHSLDHEDLIQTISDLGGEEIYKEVFEWWVVSDPLKYRLEQLGEVFLEGFWGRCTTGQSVSLDWCCIQSFLALLKDWGH